MVSWSVAFPLVEEPREVPPLRLVERHRADETACLVGVVVRDRRLEPLALRRGLAQLPAQPAQQRDGGRRRAHSVFVQIP